MRVTMSQFLEGLKARKGSLLATLVTRTRPKLLVKNRDTEQECPWPLGVERLAVRQVTLGAIYESSVNRQREREGIEEGFVSAGLWPSKLHADGAGERDGPYTVRHKDSGKRYFAVRPRSDQEGHAIVNADSWIDVKSGEPVHPDDVAPYLPAASSSSRQGTEKKVPWQTIQLDHIQQVRTLGDVFDIVPEPRRIAQ